MAGKFRFNCNFQTELYFQIGIIKSYEDIFFFSTRKTNILVDLLNLILFYQKKKNYYFRYKNCLNSLF